MQHEDCAEVTVINASPNIALKVRYLENGVEKTLGVISPSGCETYERKIGSSLNICHDDGSYIDKITVSPETRRITVDPPPLMLQELANRFHTPPNLDPVLSSYDPRLICADEIKRGLKKRIFETLIPESRNYYTTDGSLVVMNGLSYESVNTNTHKSQSRTVTSLHESREAWNIGVTVSAGKPTKSTEQGNTTTTKAPIGGKLSFQYSEANSELRSGTAGFTFAFGMLRRYRLTADAGRLALTDEFRNKVREFLFPELEQKTQFLEAVERIQGLKKSIEKIEKEIDKLEYDQYMLEEGPGSATWQTKQAKIRTKYSALKAERSACRSSQNNLETVLEKAESGVGGFINFFGTHHARAVMFGQAIYETTRYSKEALKRMHEANVQIGAEAKGNIKGIDLGLEVEAGHQRSETFLRETEQAQVARSEVGGGDMDSAEPIEIELVPLGELLVPDLFDETWTAGDLEKCREVLEVATETLLLEPDLYHHLNKLEIWEVRFRKFTNRQVSHTRQVWGSIKVTRSRQHLQDQDKELDAAPGEGGVAIWQRSNVPGAVVSMGVAGESFSDEAQRPFYLIAETDLGDPELIVSWWLVDKSQPKWVQTAEERIGRKNFSGSGLLNVNNDEITIHFEADKVEFKDLPDYKRLEIAEHMDKKLS